VRKKGFEGENEGFWTLFAFNLTPQDGA